MFLLDPALRTVTWPNTAPPELVAVGAQVRAHAPAVSGDDLAGCCLNWGYMWWQVLGSNQRRLSRRFYRPFIPTLGIAADLRIPHSPWRENRVLSAPRP